MEFQRDKPKSMKERKSQAHLDHGHHCGYMILLCFALLKPSFFSRIAVLLDTGGVILELCECTELLRALCPRVLEKER